MRCEPFPWALVSANRLESSRAGFLRRLESGKKRPTLSKKNKNGKGTLCSHQKRGESSEVNMSEDVVGSHGDQNERKWRVKARAGSVAMVAMLAGAHGGDRRDGEYHYGDGTIIMKGLLKLRECKQNIRCYLKTFWSYAFWISTSVHILTQKRMLKCPKYSKFERELNHKMKKKHKSSGIHYLLASGSQQSNSYSLRIWIKWTSKNSKCKTGGEKIWKESPLILIKKSDCWLGTG